MWFVSDKDAPIVNPGLWEDVAVSVTVIGLAEVFLSFFVGCMGTNVVSETML